MSDEISEMANLETLSAYLQSLHGNDEVALAQLTGKTDPESIRLALDILLNAKRYPEAAALVREMTPRERWCDKAVSALVWNDELESARQLLAWSKSLEDRTTRRRCLLMFAAARYEKVFSEREAGQPILPGDLAPQEHEALQEAVEALQPILSVVAGNERIDNELESRAVQLALHINSLLGEHKQCQQLAKLLATRTPVPLALAQFALQHLITASEDLPAQLRTEHPGSFKAKLLAAMVEAEQPERFTDAFRSAKQLVPYATSDYDKELLCQFLNDLGQKLEPETLTEVDTISSCLLPDDHWFRRLLYVDRLLRAGALEQVRPTLETMRDENDPRWLQLYANYLLQIGDGTSAADYFAKASKLVPHPDLLRMTAAVAFDYERFEIAAQALERIVAQTPVAITERKNLAVVYTRQKLFRKAAQQFDVLRELEPQKLDHAIHHAISLMQSGDLNQSLQVYDAICSQEAPSLQAIVGRAHVLKALSRPNEAFDSLNAVREQYWDRAEFVSAMLDLAFAAQREEMGHEALLQLQRLQAEGHAPPGLLQAVSLDDIKEEMHKYRDRRDLIHRHMLHGQWPWLAVDRLLGNVSYWAWRLRTQPAEWLGDDPLNRAQFVIYSTNSFSVHHAEGSPPSLEAVVCPPRDTAVVVDWSALITLHRLGLLEKAAEFFGAIHIPAHYVSRAVEERERLLPHQPSRRKAAGVIKEALDSRVIVVLGNPGDSNYRLCPYVSEYTLDNDQAEQHFYRLTDIVQVLHDTGLISDKKKREITAVAHQPSGVDDTHPSLEVNQEVIIALSTLYTLSSFEVLEAVFETFQVRIKSLDRDEIFATLHTITLHDTVRKWHSELWDIIRNDHRFIEKPYTLPKGWGEGRDGAEVFFAAAFLAQQEGMPLLADDRSLQMLLLNARPAEDYAAFGTDQLLLILGDSGLLNADQVADNFIQLMEWRYRFLITPVTVLKTIADRFVEFPPGRLLVSVARYMHDCMRDEGLFAGIEPTEPPVALAHRLYHAWSSVMGEFVMEVWADTRFSEAQAKQLTEWVMRELLPSPPKTMGHRASAITALTPRIVMSKAMLRSCLIEDLSRAYQGLRSIAEGFGMTEGQYLAAVSEVIDAI